MRSNSVRYIFSTGEIKRKDNSISFRGDKGNVYIPVEGIKELFCMNEVSLNTKFLDFASRARIIIHFFNYYGNYSGTFYPREHLLSGFLTVKQAECYLKNRLIVAKAIVLGIAENIYEVLYHYYRHGKIQVKPYLDWVKIILPGLLQKDINIRQVLAIEGLVWQGFYGQFEYFLPKDFLMNKRVKRPPDNPMNALISLGNSLLYAKTITQIYNTHLNQTISFLHEPRESRLSLSLDLSETFKPVIVFKTIFDVVNNRKIQIGKHFEQKLNYCILNDIGRKVFVQEFEERLESVFFHEKLKRKVTYKTAIKLDGYKLIKFIMEDIRFEPFSLKESR